jgi:double-stranded uracil-DNA glycosylase
MRKHGLEPVADGHTEVLILGTLPSDTSLRKAQYYADSRNDFWKLMEEVLNERFTNMPYEARIGTLLAHGIGLWDVYESCVRSGSMDKDISEERLNDFSLLKTMAPNLRLVCLNGKQAGRWVNQFHIAGYRTLVLPSSSSANRKNQSVRLLEWKRIACGGNLIMSEFFRENG